MSSPLFRSGPSSLPDQPEPSDQSDSTSLHREDDIPQFGLADVIEAFTAMRHEWRNQAREGRELSSAVVASVERLQQLENRLETKLDAAAADSNVSSLVYLIIDIEAHVSRAVDACVKYDTDRMRQQSDRMAAVREQFERQSLLARWLSRPFLQKTLETLNANDCSQSPVSPETEGLQLVVARLRRLMAEQDIRRLDVAGKPFDADLMNAVSVVESSQHPPGHVVEELSPAYRWRGQLLRFADVRVSK
jgi:molecular chaperone GrpE